MPFDINSTDVDVLTEFKGNAKNKTFLITGPSEGGIGAQTAISLASASPKKLILAGRDEAKVAPVISEIKKIDPSIEVNFIELNLLSNASVHKAVEKVKSITNKVDFLINNAGVMATRKFLLSEDGVESQFAVNYLGHFLLTNLLIQEGIVASGAKVVNVGSLGYQMADIQFDEINFKNGESYNGWKAYGQAKSAQLLGTRGLSRKLAGRNISVLVAHPGVTLESKLLMNSAIDEEYFGEAYAIAIERNNGNPLPPQNMVSLKQAAGIVLYTALSSELKGLSGEFIVENEVYHETREYANNGLAAKRLWELSEKLVGEKFTFAF